MRKYYIEKSIAKATCQLIKAIFIVSLFVVGISRNADASIRVGQFFSIYSDSQMTPQKAQIIDYLQGVFEGVFIANKYSGDPKFCIPDELYLDHNGLYSIIYNAVTAKRPSNPEIDSAFVPMVLYIGLRDQFPCQ